MLATFDGMVISRNAEQLANMEFPIAVMLVGRVTSCSDVQLLNIEVVSMVALEVVLNVTECSEKLFEHIPLAILVMVLGIVKLCSLVMLASALAGKAVKLLGMVIVSSSLNVFRLSCPTDVRVEL